MGYMWMCVSVGIYVCVGVKDETGFVEMVEVCGARVLCELVS